MAAKRAEIFYGAPGTGKSEAIARIMLRVAEETGKVSRVIIGDGSRATYVDNGLVDAKVVEIVDYSVRDWPMSTLKRLAEGWWPADVDDPTSPLLRPTEDTLKNLGVFAVEGFAMAAQYMMGDSKGAMASRAANGEKIGQDSPVNVIDAELDRLGQPIKDTGTGERFGGNPMSHFGFAQRRILSVYERSKALPVEFNIWTSHEKAAEDKLSKETIIGPEVVGGALTANLARIANNTFHFATATKRVKEKDEHTQKAIDDLSVVYRIYTQPHVSPDGFSTVKYIAITRGVSASQIASYFEDPEPGDSIERIYKTIKELKSKRVSVAVERIAAAAASREAKKEAA